ncbi:hypothetical protein ACOMHN_000556 [Nucella lapillus]
MDSCGKMLVAILFATATVTEALNYLALPRMGRSQGYLAFPRMGRRGYLAFPRMGRGLASGSDVSQHGADCCLTGLKMEWVPEEGGTTTTQNVCRANSCCEGLREILAQKPDGVFYSMCIPTNSCSPPEENSKVEDTSRRVLQKLNDLLRN